MMGHPSDGGSVGLEHPQAARAGNPTEPLQPLALSNHLAVPARKSVSVTRPIWAAPVRTLQPADLITLDRRS
jgi:hypothetical protein